MARLTPHSELILLARRLVTKVKVIAAALDTLTRSEAKGAAAPVALHGNVFF